MFSFKKVHLFVWLIGGIFPFPVLSFDIPSKVYGILEEHPAVQKLKLQSNAALLESSAKNGLPDPELMVGINNFPLTKPSFDDYLPTNKSIGIKQMFPSLAGREARAETIRIRSSLIDLKSSYIVHQLFGKYLKAHAEKVASDERRVVLKEQRYLLDRFEKSLNALAEVSDAKAFERLAALDVQRADLELREILLDEIAASALTQMKAIDEDLVIQNKLDGANKLRVPLEPYSFWTELLSKVSREIASADVIVKSSAYKPDFGVSLTYQQREKGTSFRGDDWISLKALIRIPFWAARTHDNSLAAAKAKENAARLGVSLSRRDSEEQWNILNVKRESALNTIARLLKKADVLAQSLKANRNNYESGLGDIASFHTIEMKQLQIKDQIIQYKLKADKTTISLHMLVRGRV